MNYTYNDLELFLNKLIRELELIGEIKSASRVRNALDFNCGLPSEFLGEARIALKSILNSENELPIEIVNEIELYIHLIDQGFRIANNPD